MITELSKNPTEEATLMAKGLPGSVYLGIIYFDYYVKALTDLFSWYRHCGVGSLREMNSS